MRRYTTPTIDLTVEEHDLTSASVYVTFQQGVRKLTLSNPPVIFDGKDSVISVELSQLESGRFTKGSCDVQVNWLEDDKRNATEIKSFAVTQNLLDEVI